MCTNVVSTCRLFQRCATMPCFVAPLRRSRPPHTNPSLPSSQTDEVNWVLLQDVLLGVDECPCRAAATQLPVWE